MRRCKLALIFLLTAMALGIETSAAPLEEFEELGGAAPDPFQEFAGRAAVEFFNRFVEQREGRAWGPEQATGPPDTPRAGDQQTAWASLTQDGQEEWLELWYEKAVIPTEVVVHATFNPGAVHKIALITAGDVEHVVWQGKDPVMPHAAKGVSRIKIDTKLEAQCVRIYLNSQEVPGWNEIDAVGLIGKDTKLQWAQRAEASTTFAEQQPRFFFDQGFDQAVNHPKADEQLKQLVREREKQLAKMIKELRNKDQQSRRQTRRFSAEMDRLQNELLTSRALIEQLKVENAALRKQLDTSQAP